MTREEITDVTPESRAECLEMVKDAYVEGPLFRPIGLRLTVMFPGTNGGSNWGGAAFDPRVPGALHQLHGRGRLRPDGEPARGIQGPLPGPRHQVWALLGIPISTPARSRRGAH